MEGKGCKRKGFFRLHQRFEHFAGSTDLHLFLPIPLDGAFTNGPVNEPTVLPGLEFPSRALSFTLRRAASDCPTGLSCLFTPAPTGYKEKELAFHMGRNSSPALLVAVNSLDGCPEKLRHLHLRLTQFFSYGYKFLAFHKCL